MTTLHDTFTVRADSDMEERTNDTSTRGILSYEPEASPENPRTPIWQHDIRGRGHPGKSIEVVLQENIDVDDARSERLDTSPARHPARLPQIQLTIPELDDSPAVDTRPPRDTGWAAWRTLIAATVVSSFVCGFYLSFGVFHDFYTSDPKLSHSNQSAWIGVLQSGVPFLAAPLMTYFCQHSSLPRIHYVWVGWLICIISLVGAAYCTKISSLIVTQGLLFGIGVTISDNPLMIIVNTWFMRRRGIAYGIVFGISDVLGVAWSFLANHLLHHYGFRTTFLTFAGIIAFGSGPCILLLKERGATSVLRRGSIVSQKTPRENVPFSSVAGNFELIRRDTPPTRQRYFQRPIFYVLFLSNLTQAFAFYLPLIYLPSYTTDLGYTSSKGAIVLATANLAQVVGEVGFGKLSDKVNVHILVVASSTTAALSTFFLWGLSKDLATLVAYSFMFGFSGAGFIALWARMGIFFGEQDAQMVYSFMCTGRGLGAIISGPISTKLVQGALEKGRYGNGKYEYLVMFVGASMAVSATLGLTGTLAACGDVKKWYQGKRSVTPGTSK